MAEALAPTSGWLVLDIGLFRKKFGKNPAILTPCDRVLVVRMLSPRQEQVAELVVRGYSDKRIASELGLCLGSVKEYVKRIGRRLGGEGRPRLKIVRWWFGDRSAVSSSVEQSPAD